MDITAQSSFLRTLWFNSETGLLTRVNITHKHSTGRMCLKRDTNRSLQWLEREISPAGGIRGDCHGERGRCTGQWCAHVAGAGASGQSLGLPAHSLFKENWLTLGSLFWITGLQELAYFCLKKVNIMLSERS